MSTPSTRWALEAVRPRGEALGLLERLRQFIARRSQAAPAAQSLRLQTQEDFADTQPDCHGR